MLEKSLALTGSLTLVDEEEPHPIVGLYKNYDYLLSIRNV
jgi:hypothetical protein